MGTMVPGCELTKEEIMAATEPERAINGWWKRDYDPNTRVMIEYRYTTGMKVLLASGEIVTSQEHT